MSTAALLARQYAASHPKAAAERLSQMAPEAASGFLDDLQPDEAADLVAEMWPAAAADVLGQSRLGRGAEVLESLPFAKAVALLRLLEGEPRDMLLGALPRSLADRYRLALTLPAGTAGSVADSTVAPFDADSTVAEARARAVDHRIPYLYIVDREQRLVGVVHRGDLDRADAEASLRSVMIDRVQTLPASAPLVLASEHVAWADHDALPVVDGRGAFVGVIRHRTLRSSLQRTRLDAGPNTALTTLLDLGEAYWSSLFSAILTLSSSQSGAVDGGDQ